MAIFGKQSVGISEEYGQKMSKTQNFKKEIIFDYEMSTRRDEETLHLRTQ